MKVPCSGYPRDQLSRSEVIPGQAIVAINLPNRTDRRSQLEAQLRSVNWKAEFFSAIRPEGPGSFPSIGARGCFLSHLEVLRDANRRKVERLIVIEDDLNFAMNFKDHWRTIENFLDTERWSIFYPAHSLTLDFVGITELEPQVSFTCCHMVVFNKAAIPWIISRLEEILAREAGDPRGGPMHVDGAYATIRAQNPEIKTFAFFPSIGYQRPSRSDIAHASWFDRIHKIDPAIRALRSIKNILLRG